MVINQLAAAGSVFLIFFKIGLCSIGGGYAVIGMIQEQAVERYGWFDAGTFTDMVAISQMTPGPLAVNISTFAGLRLAGPAGAAAATVGCAAGGAGISVLLYLFFRRYGQSACAAGILQGLKAASAGLIASAAALILRLAFDGSAGQGAVGIQNWMLPVLLVASFYLLQRKKWNPVTVMLLTGIAGVLLY